MAKTLIKMQVHAIYNHFNGFLGCEIATKMTTLPSSDTSVLFDRQKGWFIGQYNEKRTVCVRVVKTFGPQIKFSATSSRPLDENGRAKLDQNIKIIRNLLIYDPRFFFLPPASGTSAGFFSLPPAIIIITRVHFPINPSIFGKPRRNWRSEGRLFC